MLGSASLGVRMLVTNGMAGCITPVPPWDGAYRRLSYSGKGIGVLRQQSSSAAPSPPLRFLGPISGARCSGNTSIPAPRFATSPPSDRTVGRETCAAACARVGLPVPLAVPRGNGRNPAGTEGIMLHPGGQRERTRQPLAGCSPRL